MPDAAPPVNRYRRSLSRSNNNSAVLAIVYILSTLHQWFPCGPLLACHLTWLFQAFSFRAHDHGFCPQPPKVVWNLLLQAGSEGPVPHQSSSYTHWALLGPLRSWRIIARVAEYDTSPADRRLPEQHGLFR